ncbi:MAG TPA: glycerophosphodiester phosphodiesterase family protein, partial [Planctomycetota bacterium]|nr:glycerophosphodiester phosphodiesterase family protein [Planctomycetota bacterium]
QTSVPPLIAHRGWARQYPENTLSAVRGALLAGAGWVEVDVQLSADGVPYLFHDRDLVRLCGAAGPLGARTSAQLEDLRASEAGRFGRRYADEPLARLNAFVGLMAEFPRAEAFVELKRASLELFGAERVLDAVLPLLEPLGRRARLISFDVPVLAAARARSGLELGPVLTRWSDLDDPAVRALEAEVVFCDEVELRATGALDARGARLAVYEIDHPLRARELCARGATWIETFAIGEMLAALGGREGAP